MLVARIRNMWVAYGPGHKRLPEEYKTEALAIAASHRAYKSFLKEKQEFEKLARQKEKEECQKKNYQKKKKSLS